MLFLVQRIVRSFLIYLIAGGPTKSIFEAIDCLYTLVLTIIMTNVINTEKSIALESKSIV
jgi:hypothetical protein